MEYNSFYGGRRGASFVIVKAYESIPEMVTEFKKGSAYEVVNYDEYVIIDTINKNDINNGKIFRRGYDYTNDMGGAIYIGQIQGPSGMAPHTEIKTVEEVSDLLTDDNLELTDPKGEKLYRGTEGSYNMLNKGIIPGKFQKTDNDGNPLFDTNGFPIPDYNDEIHFMACSVRDADAHTSTAYIGFKIPYTVIDYTAESVSPYYNRSDSRPENASDYDNWSEYGTDTDFNNQNLVRRTDDEQHPFYEHWEIKIPKGKKGDSFTGLRVSTLAEELQNKTLENKQQLQAYANQADDLNTQGTERQRKILVYDYHNYDRVEGENDIKTLYLGDYNMIENVILDEDGTIKIDYTHNDRLVKPNWLKWVNDISITDNGGLVTINYNYPRQYERDPLTGEPDLTKPIANTETQYTTHLQWVKDIQYDEDGTITWTYSHKDNTDNKVETKPNFIKWMKEVKINPDNGKVNVIYNYPKEYEEDASGNPIPEADRQDTEQEFILTWIKDININEEGSIKFTYTTSDDDKEYPTFIKWIKDVSLNGDTGLFEVNFNYPIEMEIDASGNKVPKKDSEGNDINTQYQVFLDWVNDISLANDGVVTLHFPHKADEDLPTKIKWIKDIQITTFADATPTEEGTGTQKIKVTYNDDTSEEIGVALNYIMRTEITDDYHLVILHSDPVRRAAIVAAGNNYTWDGRDDWQDMGSVKDDDGILIGYNIQLDSSNSNLQTKSEAINYLNTTYPNGLTNPDERGKLVTIGWDDRNKDFYAFDYALDDGNYKGWYFLGYIEVSSTSFAAMENERDIQQRIDRMAEGSLWFVIEDK